MDFLKIMWEVLMKMWAVWGVFLLLVLLLSALSVLFFVIKVLEYYKIGKFVSSKLEKIFNKNK